MEAKIIDLSKYKEGVTMHINFIVQRKPFFVLITDESGIATFYYRPYDKEMLRLNLPKHPARVKVWSFGAKIKDYILQEIKIFKVPYKHNEKLKQTRDYDIKNIKRAWVPRLPGDNPARFFPKFGLMQFSVLGMGQLSQPTIDYVMKHEKGHYYYGRDLPRNLPLMPPDVQDFYNKRIEEDEIEADRFAIHEHINEGYNFSGGLFSLLDNLNPNYISKNRILNLFNEIKIMHKNIPD